MVMGTRRKEMWLDRVEEFEKRTKGDPIRFRIPEDLDELIKDWRRRQLTLPELHQELEALHRKIASLEDDITFLNRTISKLPAPTEEEHSEISRSLKRET